MSNIFIGSKKTCLGVLDREDRDKDNEICLKEGRAIEMSTTVLHYAMLALFRFCIYLPVVCSATCRIASGLNLCNTRVPKKVVENFKRGW